MANFESWFRTILWAKLAPTDTSMTVATAPTITTGRLYLNNWAQEERIKFTGVMGTTLTGLVRWLSKTADPATGGTGLSWIAGTEVKLVAMHDQLSEKNGDNDYMGNNTYSGVVTVAGAAARLDCSWAKLWFSFPSLTTTEREALTPVNWMHVYDTTLWLEYMYKAWAWVSVDTGASTPTASETVAGIVEEATFEEIDTGVDVGATGARLFVVPSFMNLHFWDWQDGNINITWWTTTLARDMYYGNLTIEASWVLNPNWYRIFVSWTFSWTWAVIRTWNAGWNGWAEGARWTAGEVLNQWSMNAEIVWVDGGIGAHGGSYPWWPGSDWTSPNPSYHDVNGNAGWNGWTGSWSANWAGGSWWISTRWIKYNNAWNLFSLASLFWSIASWSFSILNLEQYKGMGWWGWGWGWSAQSGYYGWGWGWSWSNWGTIYIEANIWDFAWTFSCVWGAGGNWGNSIW